MLSPTFVSSVWGQPSKVVVGWWDTETGRIQFAKTTKLCFLSDWWIAILKVALEALGYEQWMIVKVMQEVDFHWYALGWVANLKTCLGFTFFLSRYNTFLWLFFNIFYLYTLCTFYYLCKLCLYDLFFSPSVFLGVSELAFMLYLLFLFFLTCCIFWALKQTYIMSTLLL